MAINGLTITTIFETSAVNRDDKLAGNITSIKKLSRHDGTYSFMSRGFIRHHLFDTVKLLYKWEDAPVTVNKKVLQFNFPEANIVKYPEMDVFGFMNTSVLGSAATITRKAPLGITKAIALEPWQADMAFYANHDLVRRATIAGIDATPDPFQKEEHYSYYRVSFTLDLCRLGYQDIYLNKIPTELSEWVKALPKAEQSDLEKLRPVYKNEIKDISDCYRVEKSEMAQGNKMAQGLVRIIENKNNKNNGRITFFVNFEQYKERVQQILEAIISGLTIHSSTENYGAVPMFFVIGALKVPAPIFNSYLLLKNGAVNADILNKAIANNHVEKAWIFEGALSLDAKIVNENKDKNKVSSWQNINSVMEFLNTK